MLRHPLRTAGFAVAVLALANASAVAQSDGASVRGRVADAAGLPLIDFPVLVVDVAGRAVALRTGRDGRFATIGLAPGSVTVRLDAQGYAQLAVRCRVPAGQTASVELFASRTPGASLPAANCRLDPPTSDVYIID